MKLSCRKHRKLSVMAAYNDLPAKDREWFERHLSECDECRTAYQSVQETLGTLSGYELPGRDERQREQSWENVSAHVQNLKAPARTFPKPHWRLSYRITFASLAALLLVAFGIVIGRYVLREPVAPVAPDHASSFMPGDSLSAAQAEHASEYLDRSKVLILGIMNNNPVSTASLRRQQKVSRELIAEARLLQEELNDPRQARLRVLVAQLEDILSQIADMDAEKGITGVEVLKSGLDEGAILFKINVEQMYLDDWLHPSAEGEQTQGS